MTNKTEFRDAVKIITEMENILEMALDEANALKNIVIAQSKILAILRRSKHSDKFIDTCMAFLCKLENINGDSKEVRRLVDEVKLCRNSTDEELNTYFNIIMVNLPIIVSIYRYRSTKQLKSSEEIEMTKAG